MIHRNRVCALMAAAVLALGVRLTPSLLMYAGPSSASMQNAVRPIRPNGTINSDITLFPELSSASIRSLFVHTPERSFQFQLNAHGAVSVNGTQADAEIFSTLLEQITDLPVNPIGAFPIEDTHLILSLEILADDRQHIAHFYENSAAGTVTHIICGAPDAPEYLRTDGWRVGTLVMTCEGTRILDAYGNETPASLSI
jgi:hypothetical protein